jgi:hypothetical protein
MIAADAIPIMRTLRETASAIGGIVCVTTEPSLDIAPTLRSPAEAARRADAMWRAEFPFSFVQKPLSTRPAQ